MPKPDSGENPAVAKPEDIRNIFGAIDSEKLLAIMSLRPTIADVETASMWLAGNADVFGAGEPVKGVASKIVTILTENEEEESARAR
jgi:hypothetical protein